MTELLKTRISENILDPNVLQMYKKSHNSYQPAEQIKREYEALNYLRHSYLLLMYKLHLQL